MPIVKITSKEELHYCAIHDEDEVVQKGSTICMECWHAYLDDDAIKAEFRTLAERTKGQRLPSMVAALKGDIDIDDIGFCPICLHDW
jgi:hypothetical protein